MNSTSKLVSKAAEIVSDALIYQAEMGIERSTLIILSEPEFPIDLLKEGAE